MEQSRLSAILSFKLEQEYYKLCGFVQARMSLVILRYNSLLLHVPREKEAQIPQLPELTDGALMSPLSPWQG